MRPQLPEVVLASEFSSPPQDPYKVPFFVVAAMAGLLLLAFLWTLSRPSLDPLPDPRPAADIAETTDAVPATGADARDGDASGDPAADLSLVSSTPAVETVTLPESVITDLPRQAETAIPTRIASALPEVEPEPAASEPPKTARPSSETPRDLAAGSPDAASSPARRPPSTVSGPRALPELPLPLVETVAALEAALRSGAYAALTTTLGALTDEQEQELQRHSKARTALEFSRLAVASVRSIEAALPREPIVALREAHRLSNRFPAIEAGTGLRDRAATAIEQRGDRAISAGDADAAKSWFRELEREWPDRPGLGVRLDAADRLAASTRAQAALDRIEELERDLRLHRALEELAQVESDLPPDQAAEIRSRLERRFDFLDQRPPTVELDPAHEVVAVAGAATEIRLRVEDDYRVSAVRAYIRSDTGGIVELAVSSEGGRYYSARVPAEIREPRISLWAEADDLGGRTGKLGSPAQPIRIRVRRR